MALNAEMKMWLWTPNDDVTLNAKREMNDGSKRQNENVAPNAKRKHNMITLNVNPKPWL